jgi:hypothetical protein
MRRRRGNHNGQPGLVSTLRLRKPVDGSSDSETRLGCDTATEDSFLVMKSR